MKYTVLGRTGARVSRISLGGYPFGGVNHAQGWNPFEPEGKRTAIRTIHRALDLGISIIDTAPGYGDRHSERIIGEVMASRRDECFLATKVGWGRSMTGEAVQESVHESLRCLRTDVLDLVQFHGGMFTPEDYEHIVDGGLLQGLLDLKKRGKVRFVGVTSEEPWTLRQFVRDGRFDVIQVRYNLIYQSAAHHLLDEARDANVGVLTMRSLTSGIFQRLVRNLSPEWQEACDVSEVALRFLLSDSRVHAPNIGMRWEHEVERNVRIVAEFEPSFDIADFPRGTRAVYDAEDADAAGEGAAR